MERIQKIGALISVLFIFNTSPSFSQVGASENSQTPFNTPSPLLDEAYPQDAATDPDEFDPYDPRAEERLEEFDKVYEQETGKPAHLESTQDFVDELISFAACRRADCPVWIQIVRSTQKMYLYLNGRVEGSWDVSTGISGHRTPSMDTNPNGRIYDKYSSKAYPGGDYNGLGNMPYAVFIRGPFAMHGTPKGNWSKLGKPASKGCIRMHPDNGYRVNRLVRSYGIKKVWVTVQ